MLKFKGIFKSYASWLGVVFLPIALSGCGMVDDALEGTFGQDQVESTLDIVFPKSTDRITFFNQEAFPVTGVCQAVNQIIVVRAAGAISDETVCNGDSEFSATLDFKTAGLADGPVTIEAFYKIANSQGNSMEEVTLDKLTLPFIFIASDTAAEATNLVLQVTLDHGDTLPVVFEYSLIDREAASPADFAAVSNQTFSMSAGISIAAITVPAIDDAIFEVDEVLLVSLSNSQDSYIGEGVAQATITDNDPMPSLTVFPASATEGGTLQFVVSLDTISGADSIFNYRTWPGVATSPNDYVNVVATATIPTGATITNLSLPALTDALYETSEIFSVSLSSFQRVMTATPGVTDQATGTILDANPQPTLFVTDESELEGAELIFTVTLSAPSALNAVFTFETFDGTATTADSDYTGVSATTVTLLGGAPSLPITISTGNDTNFEVDETMTVSLTPVSGVGVATAGTDDVGTGTIRNDDAGPMLYVDDLSSITEGTTGQFVVSLSQTSGVDTVFSWQTYDGTATQSDSDYSAVSSTQVTIPSGSLTVGSFFVITTADTTDEFDENFLVSLTTISGAGAGDLLATGTITDDDLAPLIYAPDVSVTEPGTYDFFVTISAASDKEISFSAESVDVGSATGSGTDYIDNTAAVFTIPAGSISLNLVNYLRVVDDVLGEGTESFEISLSSFNNVGAGDIRGQVDISDDEGPSSLFITDITQAEGDAGTADLDFVVSLNAPSGVDAVFDFDTFDGTATAGSLDYVARSETFTIPSGSSQITIAVTINGDTTFENDETFTATLSALAGVTIAGDLAGVATISNDDLAPSLYIDDFTVTEETTANFVISISEISSLDAVFTWASASGTATEGTDYTATNGTETISPGSTAVTLPIIALPTDALNEGNETFTISLAITAGAQAGDMLAAGTVIDNDGPPSLFIADAAVSEGDTVDLLVTLSTASGSDVVFDLQTFDGTAVQPGDYTSLNLTDITISAGLLAATIPFVSVEDTIYEGTSELLTATISNITNANPGDVLGNITITEDDSVPLLSIYDDVVNEGETLGFVVSLNVLSDVDAAFDYTNFDGSASVADSDYPATTGRLTIAAGSSQVTISVVSTEDTKLENNEDFEISLSNYGAVSTATPGTTNVANGTINNDDSGPSLFINDLTLNEGETQSFVISLSEVSALDASFMLNLYDGVPASLAASSLSSDYTDIVNQVYTIPAGSITAAGVTTDALIDTLDEYDENYSVTLSALSGALAGDISASVEITDQNAVPNLYVSDATITEGETGSATISLDAASGKDVVVFYETADDTAVAADYTGIGATPVTLLAGATTLAVSFVTTEDAIIEGAEQFFVSLSSPVNAGILDDVGNIGITDDDGTLFLAIYATAENEGDTLVFDVSLSAISGQNVTFSFNTFDGAAEDSGGDNDFVEDSGSKVINAGSVTAQITIVSNEDTKLETNEAFEVSLSSVVGASIQTPGTTDIATGTINNDDVGPQVFIADGSVNEGTSSALVISLSELSALETSFRIDTFDGTPTLSAQQASGDYTQITNLVVTIPAGNLTLASNFVDALTDSVDEYDEAYQVSLSSFNNSSAGDDLGVITISDQNLAPQIFIDDLTLTEGQSAQAVVSLAAASAKEVTFSYQTFDGTAGGTDYVSIVSGFLTISAGSTTVGLMVQTSQDAVIEGSEVFNVSLSSLQNASAGDDINDVTINDDDGTLNIAIFDDAQTEGTDLVFDVSISAVSGANVTFSYNTFDGTATTADSDYSSGSGSGTILAGNQVVSVTVSSNVDVKFEGDETFALSLSSVVGANVITPGSDDMATGTINNDDSAPAVFVDDLAINEGQTLSLVISLSAVSGVEAVFDWQSFDGSALQPNDYTATSSTRVTIPSGSLTASNVLSNALIDGLDEDGESYLVSLSAVSGITVVGSDLIGSVTITDVDAEPGLFVVDVTLTEPETSDFVVSLSAVSGKEVVFQYSTQDTGSAASTQDFTSSTGVQVTIPVGVDTVTVSSVTALDDAIFEGTESYRVTLAAVANATLSDSLADVTILDDETAPSLLVYSDSVTEGSTLGFIVSLSGTSSTVSTFDVDTFDGTATTGDSDYTGVSSTSYTIAAGDLQLTVPVVTGDDTKFEVNETLAVSLSSVVGPTIVTPGTDDMATGTINNDDSAPAVFVDDLAINEGQTLSLVISLSAVSGVEAVFDWQSFDGSALQPNDYTATSSTRVTIPSGSLTASNVLSNALIDGLDEDGESYLVSLSAVSGTTVVGSDLIGTVTITDVDAEPGLFVVDVTLTEPETSDFVVSLSAVSGKEVVFQYSTQDTGSAASTQDFTSSTGVQVTIPVGVDTVTVSSVTALDDSIFEGTESYRVTLAAVANATLSDSLADVTILDDETAPSLLVYSDSVTEGSTLGFIVSLSGTLSTVSTFDVDTFDGTATTGDSDYTGVSSTSYTIAAGDLQLTVPVVTGDDTKFEVNETLAVSLSSVVGANVITPGSDDMATGTINNDDSEPLLFVDDLDSVEGSVVIAQVTTNFTLSAISGVDVVFNYELLDGVPASLSAESGVEYTVGAVAVTIPAGSLSAGATALGSPIPDDSVDEYDEIVLVSLSAVTGATEGDYLGSITIADNDSEPNLFIDDLTIAEGATATAAVSLSVISDKPISFSYQTFDGTADTADYTQITSTTVTIPAGNSTIGIEVITTQDSVAEGNQNFIVSLSNPVNVTVSVDEGLMTITDDDVANLFVTDSSSVAEGGTSQFVVSLSTAAGSDVTFAWQTADGTATAADSDYSVFGATSLTIGTGASQVTIQVATTQDNQFESDETFALSLSDVSSNASVVDDYGIVTIANDETLSIQFAAESSSYHEGSSTLGGPYALKSLGLGAAFTCGIGQSQKAFCWGNNSSVQLGNGDSVNLGEPAEVSLGEGTTGEYLDLNSGSQHTCGLSTDDQVYCWGLGTSGQLGNGLSGNQSVPVAVDLPSGVIGFQQLGVGYFHSCAIGDDDKAYCWGDGTDGILGNESTASINSPVAVSLGDSTGEFAQIDAGDSHTCAVGLDSRVFCWGSNFYGQLGTNDEGGPDQTSPQQVALGDGPSFYKRVATGRFHVCGLGSDDKAYCWGLDGQGQIGNGSGVTGNQAVPSEVVNGDSPGTYKFLMTGGVHTCGIGTDDQLYCWGQNDFGQIGIGSVSISQAEPVLVSLGAGPANYKFVAGGGVHTCAVGSDNKSYCWGGAGSGRGGDADTSAHLLLTPSLVLPGENTSGLFDSPLPEIHITLTAWFASDITVPFSVVSGGSASGSGVDYDFNSVSQLTVSSGDLGVSGSFDIIDDLNVEVDEEFTITLGSPSQGALGTQTTHTVTIIDNDSAIDIFISDAAAVTEGGTAEFVISLASAATTDVTFAWQTFDGTATAADSDYSVFGATSLTIGTGASQVTIQVATTDDNQFESDETFAVSISDVSSSANVLDDYATGTITNDESLQVEFLAANQVFSESSTTHHQYGFYMNAQSACGLAPSGQVYCWGWASQGRLGNGLDTGDFTVPVAVSVGEGPSTYKSLAGGYFHTCGLGTDNRAYCWGEGNSGEIGNGIIGSFSVPTAASAGEGSGEYSQLAIGGNHSCGLGLDSKAYCWGDGADGRLGNGGSGSFSTPVQVSNGGSSGSFRKITTGFYHSCALESSGTAYCWGLGSNGQIGDGDTGNHDTPRQVATGAGPGVYKEIDSGTRHTCGLGTDDSLYCWGFNNSGQLGDNSTSNRNSPVSVSLGAGPATYKQVSAGGTNFTCGLGSDDKAYCWGDNSDGRLGAGAGGNQLTPVEVSLGSSPGTFLQLSAGNKSVCALGIDNSLYCWGLNDHGQLGDSSTTDRNIPVSVLDGANTVGLYKLPVPSFDLVLTAWFASDITVPFNVGGSATGGGTDYDFEDFASVLTIAAGETSFSGAFTIVDDSSVEGDEEFTITLGSPSQGSLGTQTTHTVTIVDNDSFPVLDIFVSDAAAVTEGGTAEFVVSLASSATTDVTFAWQTFDGTATAADSDYSVFGATSLTIGSGASQVTIQIATTQDNQFELDESFAVSLSGISTLANPVDDYAVGTINNDEVLTIEFSSSGQQREEGFDGYLRKSLGLGGNHSCAVAQNQNVYCWGRGTGGQLGDGNNGDHSSPVSVLMGEGPGTYHQLGAGDGSTCGLGTDERIYCWGRGGFGRLGNNSTSDTSSPVSIHAGEGPEAYKQLAVGYFHSCALGSDNRVYCWGSGGTGQLGTGASVASEDSAVSLAFGEGPSTYKLIAAGGYSSCGVGSDSGVYCWGMDNDDQLGNGTISGNQVAPVSIHLGESTGSFKQVAIDWYHACAIGTDDLAYCWGSNSNGQLGDNNLSVDQDAPVSIHMGEGPGTYSSIEVGQNISCALGTDDRVYCWGTKVFGGTGNGSTSGSEAAPVSIHLGGSPGTFQSIEIGYNHVCALGSDDQAYCWGSNFYGNSGGGPTPSTVTTPRLVLDGDNSGGLFYFRPEESLQFTVNLTAWFASDITVPFTSGGEATGGGVDYDFEEPPSSVMTIAAGETSFTGSITIIDDLLFEGDEEFVITLSSTSQGSLGSQITHTVTIVDNDPRPGPDLFISDASSVTEGGTSAFVISLASAAASDITFAWQTFDGTATAADSDYSVFGATSLTIGTGASQVTISVATTDDNQLETDEDFAVSLSDFSSNVNVIDDYALGTIANDETLTIEFIRADQSVDEDASGELSVRDFAGLSVGDVHSCGIAFDNQVLCWGNGASGRIGDGDTGNHSSPVTIALGEGPSAYKAISSGVAFTCGLGVDDAVYCWGQGNFGQLGDGNTGAHNSPVSIIAGEGPGFYQQVSSGDLHACALGSDDRVYCWGRGDLGRLGNGALVNQSSAVSIAEGEGPATYKSVSAGRSHSCALGSDDWVYCWGEDDFGRLGSGDGTLQSSAVSILIGESPAGYKSVAAGHSQTCALGSDDRAYCWGFGNSGQLGNGSTGNETSAVSVHFGAGPGTYKSLATGSFHSCALGSDDKVYCWGRGTEGQLGNADTGNHSVPVAISLGSGPATYKGLMVDRDGSCALGSDDRLYCWGEGTADQLGDGSSSNQSSPVAVLAGENTTGLYVPPEPSFRLQLTAWFASEITVPFTVGGTATGGGTDYDVTDFSSVLTIAAGETSFSGAITINDDSNVEGDEEFAITLGSPSQGSLGTQTTHTVTIVDNDVASGPNLSVLDAGSVSEGGTAEFIVSMASNATSDVTFAWSTFDGTATAADSDYSVFSGVSLTIGTGTSQITIQVATTDDVQLEGDEEFSVRLSDVSSGATVIDDTGIASIANDDTLSIEFARGGQEVNEFSALSSETERVFSMGAHHGCIIGSDRNLYCWGRGTDAQLGNNDGTVSRTSPVLVSLGDSSGGFEWVTGGSATSCALDSSGEAFCWGRNDWGQVGIDDTGADVSIPAAVSIGQGTGNYLKISSGWNHTCAIGDDSKAYCWGRNDFGQLGGGVQDNAPLTISAGEGPATYESIYAGTTHTCALDSSGRAYCWGQGANGALGHSEFSNESAPVAVSLGASTGKFKQISTWSELTCGVGTDDRAYCWGLGEFGKIGNGTTISASVPTQVSQGAGPEYYYQAVASTNHACGLGSDYKIYCWGQGLSGALGDGGVSDSSLPVEVSLGSGPGVYKAIDLRFRGGCGYGFDEQVYCWGFGGTGDNGDGTFADKLVPVLVLNGANTGGMYKSLQPQFRLLLSAWSPSEVTVPFTVGGTASGSGTDYGFEGFSSVLTIAAGETSFTGAITINDDSNVEVDEEFVLQLGTPSEGVIGSQSTHTVTIVDNETGVLESLYITDAIALEGTTAVFTAYISSPATEPVVFNFSGMSGTATENVDFALAGQSQVTIPVGRSAAQMPVNLLDDAFVETDENFYVSITAVTGVDVIDNVGLGVILDDDASKPQLHVTNQSGDEGDSINVVISLTTAAGSNIDLEWSTMDGSAVSVSDYTASSAQSAQIASGNSAVTVSVNTTEDSVVEDEEYFIVYVSSLSSLAALADAVGVVSVADDDTPVGTNISLYVSDAFATDEGGVAEIEVSLSQVATADTVVVWSTVDTGSATAGADYLDLFSQYATVSSGESSTKLFVPIFSDFEIDDAEVFTVTIDIASVDFIADGSAVVTINNVINSQATEPGACPEFGPSPATSATCLANSTETQWNALGGPGTSDANPFIICTKEQLEDLATDGCTGAFTTACEKYFQLGADIDFTGETMSDYDFADSTAFTGEFDGADYEFSNMNGGSAGMAWILDFSGTLKNLKVTNLTYTGASSEYGGLLGSQTVSGPSFQIQDVYIQGSGAMGGSDVVSDTGLSPLFGAPDGGSIDSVRVEFDFEKTNSTGVSYGGIIGYSNAEVTISNSCYFGTVSISSSQSSGNAVGGLIGSAADGVEISQSFASITIQGLATGTSLRKLGGVAGDIDTGVSSFDKVGAYVDFAALTIANSGGLIGFLGSGGSSTIAISESYAQGSISVSGDLSYSGGLIGDAGTGNITITDSYTSVDLDSSGSEYIGAFIGSDLNDGSVDSVYERTFSYGTVTSSVADGYAPYACSPSSSDADNYYLQDSNIAGYCKEWSGDGGAVLADVSGDYENLTVSEFLDSLNFNNYDFTASGPWRAGPEHPVLRWAD